MNWHRGRVTSLTCSATAQLCTGLHYTYDYEQKFNALKGKNVFKVFFGSEGLFSMTLLVLGDKRCRFFARPMNLFGKDRGDATPSYYRSLSNKVIWWAFYETESQVLASLVSAHLCTVTMAIRVVEFSKLERFLYKNQHTQRKSLNFENWTNGEPQQLAKSEFVKLICISFFHYF